MMPEAAVVIAAARVFIAGPLDGSDGAVAALEGALEALDAKLLTVGQEPSKEEQDRTWGEVVAGDEILSAKTNKFYEVHTSVRTDEGKMKVMIKGSPRFIVRNATDPVRVRRGVEGEAVDILEVLFSGPTAPSEVKSIEEKVADDE
jgi:hypothetical protein